jgi:hypothetical protein
MFRAYRAIFIIEGGDFGCKITIITILGKISGTKFNDLNGNGVKDAGEPVLAGWKINLTGGISASTTTDSLGNFVFEELPANTYQVCEVQQSGWVQSLPASGFACPDGTKGYSITLGSGQIVSGKNFGNKQAGVQGCSPGYWKQSQHFGSYPTSQGVYPDTLFVTVFGENAFPGKSLLQVLEQGGGGLNALGRIIVGAYLNAATINGFPYSKAQVIAEFQAVYPGGNYDQLKNKYEALQDPCPFGRNPGPSSPPANNQVQGTSDNNKKKK